MWYEYVYCQSAFISPFTSYKNTFWKHIILQLLCLIEIATHEKILATAIHQGHEPKHDFGFLVAEVEIEWDLDNR